MLTGMRFSQVDNMMIKPDDRYSRDVKNDVRIAIDLLIAFKEELDKLHPECSQMIETLLQNPNRLSRY